MGEDQPEHMRKIFVGGLDYISTDDSMQSYFSEFGEIQDVIVMRHPQTKKSRGFGFVTFGTSAMVDFVMNKRPHKLDGRTIDVKRVVPKSEIGKPEANVTVRKIFVGGIRDDVQENDLIETFSDFGQVLTVSIPLIKDTNKQRGFAFVEFEDSDAVDKAVLHKNIILKGKKVEVKKALRKDQLPPTGENGSGGGGWGGNQGDGYGSGYNNNWGGNNEGTPDYSNNQGYGAPQSYAPQQGWQTQTSNYSDPGAAAAAAQAWSSQQYAAAYGMPAASYTAPTASYASYDPSAQGNAYGTQPAPGGGYGATPPPAAPGLPQYSAPAPPTSGGYSAPPGGQWGGSPPAPSQQVPADNYWQSSAGPVRSNPAYGQSNRTGPYTTGARH